MVDDDREMCEELKEILEGEGYQVTLAGDGLAAKRLLEKKPFEGVLLDLKLPKLNGLEVLRWAKEEKVKARIVVLTGSPTSKDVEKGEKLPMNLDEKERQEVLATADGFLNKPYEVETLLEEIRRVLD